MASSASRPKLAPSVVAIGCVVLSGCQAITGLDDLFVREGAASSTGTASVSGSGGTSNAGGMGGLGAAGGGGHAGGGAGGAGGSPCLGDASLDYPETVLCDEPLAYWRFNETDPIDAIDEVGNAHPGHYRNSATTGADGVADSTAAEFHGDGYVEIGDFFSFLGTDHFSIEAWVMPSSTMPLQSGIVSKFDGTGKRGYYLGVEPNGLAGSRSQDSMDAAYLVVGLPPTDKFTHIVLTYDGKTLRLYRDGKFQGKDSDQSLVQIDNELTIGSFGGWGYFDGRIDEVAIYGDRLADSRIVAHYTVGVGQ